MVEGGAVAYGYVVDLVQWGRGGRGLPRFARNDGGGGRCGGQQVGLHGVVHVAKVAAGFAVAVDVNGFAFEECGGPFGDDGGVGTVRVLAGAKHVEVAQADGVEAVAAGKDVGIQLVDVFGDGVGAQRFADVVFDLGQRGVVAVGAAAGGVGEALHLGVAGGHEHVEEAGDVGVVGGDGVGQAAGHAAQGGLVQDVVNGVVDRWQASSYKRARHGCSAVFQLADVALDEVEVGPLGGGDQALHFVQVALVAGGEVVQANHALVELEQGLQQVTADEAGHACDEPGFGRLAQFSLYLFVAGHFGVMSGPWLCMSGRTGVGAPGGGHRGVGWRAGCRLGGRRVGCCLGLSCRK